ncbi:hypothetical protein V7799_02495 [Rhizobium laguerreae]
MKLEKLEPISLPSIGRKTVDPALAMSAKVKLLGSGLYLWPNSRKFNARFVLVNPGSTTWTMDAPTIGSVLGGDPARAEYRSTKPRSAACDSAKASNTYLSATTVSGQENAADASLAGTNGSMAKDAMPPPDDVKEAA